MDTEYGMFVCLFRWGARRPDILGLDRTWFVYGLAQLHSIFPSEPQNLLTENVDDPLPRLKVIVHLLLPIRRTEGHNHS